MGMVAGVHDRTANGGTETHVTGAAGLTEHDVGMVDVAYLTDSSLGVHGNQTNLAAGKTYLSVLAFLGHELRGVAGGANQLGALAGLYLDAVDHGAYGDVLYLKSVADLDISVLAGDNGVANVQAQRSDDVALLAVRVMQQGDVGGTVGVVLDGSNLCGYSVLIALEVDYAILALCVNPSDRIPSTSTS